MRVRDLFEEYGIVIPDYKKSTRKNDTKPYKPEELMLYYDEGGYLLITEKTNLTFGLLEYGKGYIDTAEKYNMEAILDIEINKYSFYINDNTRYEGRIVKEMDNELIKYLINYFSKKEF